MDDYSDEEFSKSVSFKKYKSNNFRKDLEKINKYPFQLVFWFKFFINFQEKNIKVSSRTQVLKRGPGRPPKDRSAENSLFAEVIVKNPLFNILAGYYLVEFDH